MGTLYSLIFACQPPKRHLQGFPKEWTHAINWYVLRINLSPKLTYEDGLFRVVEIQICRNKSICSFLWAHEYYQRRVLHLLVFPPVKYPCGSCSRTRATCKVSRVGISVGSLANSSRMSLRKGGQGKVHSYGLMVKKKMGTQSASQHLISRDVAITRKWQRKTSPVTLNWGNNQRILKR